MGKANSKTYRTYHPVCILRLQSVVNQVKVWLNRVFKPKFDKTKNRFVTTKEINALKRSFFIAIIEGFKQTSELAKWKPSLDKTNMEKYGIELYYPDTLDSRMFKAWADLAFERIALNRVLDKQIVYQKIQLVFSLATAIVISIIIFVSLNARH